MSALQTIFDLYANWTKATVPTKWLIIDDTVADDIACIEYVHKWQKQVDSGYGTTERWALRDERLAAYFDEPARTPPSPDSWDSWEPVWKDRSACPSEWNRSQFSSNDWAMFEHDVYLTRREHR